MPTKAFGPQTLVLLILCVGIAACDAESPNEPSASSSPRITGVTPPAPIASPSPQLLQVRGERFQTGLSMVVTSPDGATLTVPPSGISDLESSSFQTTVVLEQAGSYTLAVRNATAETSPPFELSVVASPGQNQPVITAVVPASLTRSTFPQSVLVQGVNFAAGLSVSVIDPDGLVSVQSAGAVDNVTPSSFQLTMVFGKVGTYSIRVVNPSGDASNVMNVVAGQ